MSQQFIGALVVLLIGILQLFGIVVEQETLLGLVTGIVGIWIAIRRYKQGDISIAGMRK